MSRWEMPTLFENSGDPDQTYIVKLEFTGLYTIFLIFAENIDCGFPLEPPRRGGYSEYQQSIF